ncbi:MAG: STAS domain-containing protein [Bacteroidales bacterium]|jgi:anti-anti-sigma factor
MKLTVNQANNYTVIAINGRIDTISAVEFEGVAQNVLKSENHSIIMDCAELEYITSSGLRVFLVLQKSMLLKKGRIVFCGFQPGIKEIFDISGFSGIFQIYPDLNSAIESCK